ncbi:protein FAF-like, chloroplastic [Cajanus cajan]|uniref:protein FAF-like, chloroplastic n=1 Tax=Cajanus cajan TaxID=3821 RepID=UPI00098DCD0F|nr:protein FAF-like, chloroplastic [Cajanus cajan]
MSATSMTMTNNVQSLEEETTMPKQGIITILDSNSNTASSCSSLRRTLSADMSSKHWLSQTIADSEAERERLEIWSSIQKSKKEEQEKSAPFDTWSTIISLKGKDEISKSLPVTPYVHPLVKRSKSLSEKSLQICTESLGSETGSDGLLFSSYPSSETGDVKKEEKVFLEPTNQEQEEGKKEEEFYNYVPVATKKASSPPRAFPPPLPSLSHHHQAAPSLHMHSRRDNGRLVLEAVSVPSQNNFSVQRQDGRLVLTFSNHLEEEEENDDHVEEEYLGECEFEENEDYEEEYEGEKKNEDEYSFGTRLQVSSTEDNSGLMGYESVIEKAPLLSSGVRSSVHELALMMNKNKPIGLVNRNPKWSEKFNEMSNFEDVNVAQSLPPRPRVARLIPSAPAMVKGSFNFNAYEYCWRTKSATSKGTGVNLNPLDQEKHHHQENLKSKVVVSGNKNKALSNEQQQLLVLRGKNGDYLVHNLKSCKDSRRSFLFWEPYCIATS